MSRLYFLILTIMAGTINPLAYAGYVKVSNSGRALPVTTVLGNGPDDWACTYDDKTKLMWEVKTTDGGLRSQDWTYTWYDPATSSGIVGTQNSAQAECYDKSNCNTESYQKRVNATSLCGSKAWRLPSRSELISLVYCSDGVYKYPSDDSTSFICTSSPEGTKIDSNFFPNTLSKDYWTVASSPYNKSYAWYVDFSVGHVFHESKSIPFPVRLVFSEPTFDTSPVKPAIPVIQSNSNCTTVDKNTNINVACALYNNKNYQATLPFDLGRYQKTNELTWGVSATEQATRDDPNKECVKVDSAVNLYMPCLIYQDQKYFANFKWHDGFFSLDLSDFHSANSASLFINDPNSQVKATIVSNNTGAVFLQHRPAANLPAELDKIVLYHPDGTTSELALTPISKSLQAKASLPLVSFAKCIKTSAVDVVSHAASYIEQAFKNLFTGDSPNDPDSQQNDYEAIKKDLDATLTCIQGGIDEAQRYDEKKIGDTLKGVFEQMKWQLESAKFNKRGVVTYSLDKIESTLSDNALANLVIQRVKKLLPDKINLPSKPDAAEEALIPTDKLLVLDNNNTPTKLSTLVAVTPVTPNPTLEPVTAPTVSAVTPASATVGEKLILSVRGKNMSPLNTVSLTLDDCPNVINDGGTEDLMSFTCTPTSIGTKAGTAKETKTGNVLFTFQVVVSLSNNKPTITAFSYSPNPAIQNKPTKFSIAGSNFTDRINYYLNGCNDVTELAGGTSSKRQFTCTPTILGTWNSTVIDNPLVQNFDVVVVAPNVSSGLNIKGTWCRYPNSSSKICLEFDNGVGSLNGKQVTDAGGYVITLFFEWSFNQAAGTLTIRPYWSSDNFGYSVSVEGQKVTFPISIKDSKLIYNKKEEYVLISK